MEEEKKSGNLYKFVNSSTNNTKDSRETVEQMLFDGDKGMTIKLFKRKKVGDKDNVLKVTIKEVGDNKYGIRVKNNDKVDESEVNMDKLKKFLKDNKHMDFALNYISKDMEAFRKKIKSQSGGGKRRKSSKKTSKRKTSKKKSSKKRTSRKKTSKKKTSRKKTSRKKTSKRKSSRRKSSRK